jgi:hypothetical protein
VVQRPLAPQERVGDVDVKDAYSAECFPLKILVDLASSYYPVSLLLFCFHLVGEGSCPILTLPRLLTLLRPPESPLNSSSIELRILAVPRRRLTKPSTLLGLGKGDPKGDRCGDCVALDRGSGLTPTNLGVSSSSSSCACWASTKVAVLPLRQLEAALLMFMSLLTLPPS